MTPCARCGGALSPGPYGRRDTCPACGAELRACVQCAFYAPGLHNDCRETQAERVLDKGRANFCDYFRAVGRAPGPDPRAEAQAKLDALFRKKP
ncbi:MAG: hypothetical protein ACYDA8_10535 [Deferrisomatales bacterium]